jgi:large subunit ribosomal protein L28
MARTCQICGKRPRTGNAVSHSNKKTKRRWLPNIQKYRIITNEKKKTITICTKCLKANKIQKAV